MADPGATKKLNTGEIIIELAQGIAYRKGQVVDYQNIDIKKCEEPTIEELCSDWDIDLEFFDQEIAPKLMQVFCGGNALDTFTELAPSKEKYDWKNHRKSRLQQQRTKSLEN
jgi:hypothetical protein